VEVAAVMMMYLRHRILRRQAGQAAVELALVIPLLLLLVFGVFEFGRLLNAYLTLQHAAREGARLGVLGATDSEIIAVIESTAVTLRTSDLVIEISPIQAGRTAGTIMTVTVTYAFEVVVPVISGIIGSSLPITSTLSMRVE